MSTAEIRGRIHEYVDRADERMLRIIEELIKWQEDYDSEIPSWQKAILDKRIAAHDKNPDRARKWEDVRIELKNNLASQQ